MDGDKWKEILLNDINGKVLDDEKNKIIGLPFYNTERCTPVINELKEMYL